LNGRGKKIKITLGYSESGSDFAGEILESGQNICFRIGEDLVYSAFENFEENEDEDEDEEFDEERGNDYRKAVGRLKILVDKHGLTDFGG